MNLEEKFPFRRLENESDTDTKEVIKPTKANRPRNSNAKSARKLPSTENRRDMTVV